jgi:hypothetical protein
MNRGAAQGRATVIASLSGLLSARLPRVRFAPRLVLGYARQTKSC